MSLADTENMTPQTLISLYILETRGKGHFLPYKDLEIIEDWLLYCNHNPELLLLILHEHLPKYFEKKSRTSIQPSLSGLKNLILKKIAISNK